MSVRQTNPVDLVAVPVPVVAAPEMDARSMDAPAAPRRRSLVGPAGLATAAAVVALVAGGWWFARHRNVAAQPAAQQNVANASLPITPAAPPQAAASTPASTATAPATTESAPRAKAATAGVGFDPRTLDPKTNAKLKIELSKVPDGTPFTVEMNGRAFLNGVAGNKSTFENSYVPPGVQEFRVVMKAAGERKASNIVSDEFKAKKHKTLKIELEGLGPGGAPTRDTQVFVGLK